jgi:hypothetical protein
MKVFYNTEFDGHYPVGAAALVVAKDAKSAAKLLETQLGLVGLPQHIFVNDMVEVKTNKETTIMLNDGEY